MLPLYTNPVEIIEYLHDYLPHILVITAKVHEKALQKPKMLTATSIYASTSVEATKEIIK